MPNDSKYLKFFIDKPSPKVPFSFILFKFICNRINLFLLPCLKTQHNAKHPSSVISHSKRRINKKTRKKEEMKGRYIYIYTTN